MLVVTGAAGFIGSNIIAALNAAERDDVLAVDNAGAQKNGNLDGLQYQRFLSKEDLIPWLHDEVKGVTGIIHMGACSDTTVTDRDFVMKNNFEYTRKLWKFCKEHRKKFIYASSAATYGNGTLGYDDAMDISRLQPLNLYGQSKQRFDLWALEQKQKGAPPEWAGLKFFNVYGPRESKKGRMASVVFHSYRQIRESGKVRLFKSDRAGIPDGGQKRDFVYVKDVAAVVLHFLRSPAEKMNGIFNVGTGQARTFADLATAVFSALKLPPQIEYIDMPADLAGKYQYFTEAKIERLRAAGYTAPFHSLEDGVRDYVCHYLAVEVKK
ncbi:MAG TPA: ADP-glyceromanno-heptose 6-epimerase [Planctomycetota bacterium]|nr:ADP-glyceromanno-heptose 6-epimerase [Planctomycetota bacterium]